MFPGRNPMKSIFNRLSTGLATAVIVLAQVVMPVQAAFAYTIPTGIVNKVQICHANNSSNEDKVYVSNEPSVSSVDPTAGHAEHTGPVWDSTLKAQHIKWGDIIPPFDYLDNNNQSAHFPGYNWTTAGQAIYANDCSVPGYASAVNGRFTDDCGPSFNAAFVSTPTTGVTYHPVTTGNTITVTATANTGYALTDPEWSQTYTDQLVACQTETESATPQDGVFADKCGIGFNLGFTAAVTEGVTYHPVQVGNTINVTATANQGYTLSDPNWTQSQTDQLTACPTVKPCVDTTDASVITTKEQFATYADTTSGTGEYEFVENGLRISTTDDTLSDRVAWFKSVNFSLADAGEPTMVADTNSGTIPPGLHMKVDFDNDGTIDGTIVGESAYYGNNWWLTENSDADVIANAPHDGTGQGSPYYGTLSEWLNKYPNAKVMAVGFSLGSGVEGDYTLRSITFNCIVYTFDKKEEVKTPPTPAFTPKTCLNQTASILVTYGEDYEYTITPPGAQLISGEAYELTDDAIYTVNGYEIRKESKVFTQDYTVETANGCGGGIQEPPKGDNPVTPGKGAGVTQPVTELPHTGAGTNALLIGLLAAGAAYGAVYFAQPKRRYE